ncbi:MAG: 30S ribosomal protein S17 [Verrucomicrobia bacterium]|nr:30S ribosomal protein S17 [Verrucomicrobiota bacterium]
MPVEVSQSRGTRKERKGRVVSKSGNKSVVVLTESRGVHPKYGKVIKHFKKFHVHDEGNSAKVGDLVTIVETRPLSKLKRWRLKEIVESAQK